MSLWQRYDEGGLPAEELDARLQMVDAAGDNPDALERALHGPVQTPRSRRRRLLPIAGAAVLVIAAVALSLGETDGGSSAPLTTRDTTGNAGVTTIPGPLPLPAVEDCPELDDYLAQFEAIDEETPPANPALLSEPAALPEGYSLGDEEDLVPGSDPDIAMNVSAGTPAPIEILARSLTGELKVTMRSWRYATPDEAGEAARSVAAQGVCTYDLQPFDVPDRPEINGSVVSGPIPTTAFAGFRMAERRFSVAVVAAVEGDEAATEAARQLAGAIAAMEYDAARRPPPPG